MKSKERILLIWLPMIFMGLVCAIASISYNPLVALGEGLIVIGIWYGMMSFVIKRK